MFCFVILCWIFGAKCNINKTFTFASYVVIDQHLDLYGRTENTDWLHRTYIELLCPEFGSSGDDRNDKTRRLMDQRGINGYTSVSSHVYPCYGIFSGTILRTCYRQHSN